MSENPISLAPFYKGWDVYQQHLVHALAPLSSDQLALRLAPHLRSVGMIATHIIGVRAGWFVFVLGESAEVLTPFTNWHHPNQPVRSATELVSGLETTWRVIQDALARWTVADLEAIFHDIDDDGVDNTLTRQWVIWHLIEHDLHHGGEISFALGTHSLPAIDL